MVQVRDGLTSALAPEVVYQVRCRVARNIIDVESSLKPFITFVVNLATPNKRSNRFDIVTRAKTVFGCQIRP